MGTRGRPPAPEAGYPRRSGKDAHEDGALVVVGARESRAHGEGGQRVGQPLAPEQWSVDSDQQAKAWLLSVQRKLYQWSKANPGEPYRDLWNWVIDPRNLRCAWLRVASNRGARSSGIDGVTVGRIRQGEGEDTFLTRLRLELRTGRYHPSPCRRRLIPKRGKPGEFRPLGIPTVRDRVVQSAVKQIVEPIFEAGFWHVSYGFRPGRGCHGALEHIRMTIRPMAVAHDGKRRTVPYAWLIEGDIKSCFDRIGHHQLMDRVRTRLVDRKVTRLLSGFLKAGALSETQFIRTDAGTPQGGIISPLLANIALSVIEERYERWVNLQTRRRPNRKADGIRAACSARITDRHAGRPVFFPIRYADDFVVLVAGTREQADTEKEALADFLRERLGLELSPAKTRTTATTDGFNFLGHRVRLRWDPRFGYTPRIEIPKEKRLEFRHRIKELTGRDRTYLSLTRMLHELNHILRGWGHFYRFCTNAKRFLNQLDWYVRDRIWRWLRKKYPKTPCGRLTRFRRPITGGRQVVWATSTTEQYLMARLPVMRYRRGWMQRPDFAVTLGEPGA
jgi:RNA-directed DNA polymerase